MNNNSPLFRKFRWVAMSLGLAGMMLVGCATAQGPQTEGVQRRSAAMIPGARAPAGYVKSLRVDAEPAAPGQSSSRAPTRPVALPR